MLLGAMISLTAALVSRRAEREGGPGPIVGAHRTRPSTGLLLLSGTAVALARRLSCDASRRDHLAAFLRSR